MLSNYFFSALAGTTWYLQFFFYTMGETQMGKLQIFQLDPAHGQHHHLQHAVGNRTEGMERRWHARRTIVLVVLSLVVLVGSTIIVGYGNYLASPAGSH